MIKVTCCDRDACWRSYTLADFERLPFVREDEDTGDVWRRCRCGKPVVCRLRTLRALDLDLRDPFEMARDIAAPWKREQRRRRAVLALAALLSLVIVAVGVVLWTHAR